MELSEKDITLGAELRRKWARQNIDKKFRDFIFFEEDLTFPLTTSQVLKTFKITRSMLIHLKREGFIAYTKTQGKKAFFSRGDCARI
jgi:hypothetical protein